ncbi:MAG TPA: YqiA/YcfP family alpha/beta fold hydrolase [Bryobacteraceae bacterium]|nr:YqiA/YcfP family alpha/beta fold hydrolase [Bryobacteraceae bacterium]
MSRIIYLHGFASSPGSKKARFFQQRFAELGIGLEIPDLAEGEFARLTISGQLKVIERTSLAEPVTLMGSSLGGYLAALYAARHAEVEKLVLLAPAFCFLKRWTESLGPVAMEKWRSSGSLEVFHYGEGRAVPLGYQLIEDAASYEDYPEVRPPVLIFHGRNDAAVPPDYSVTFARKHPGTVLHLLDSDHELLNVLDDMWMETETFLFGGQDVGSSTRS